MENLEIVIIKSSFQNIELLNERIYKEIERDGYHNLVKETKEGIQQSITIFKNLKNADFLKLLLSGYEYLNDSNLYFGKVKKIESYIANEYVGSPTRLKVCVDNGEVFDVPMLAQKHLNIQLL